PHCQCLSYQLYRAPRSESEVACVLRTTAWQLLIPGSSSFIAYRRAFIAACYMSEPRSGKCLPYGEASAPKARFGCKKDKDPTTRQAARPQGVDLVTVPHQGALASMSVEAGVLLITLAI